MHRLAILICLMLGLSMAGAKAEPRLALVIGNSKYGAEIGKLPNPANDANLMAATLAKLGFKVTKLVDADQKQMKRGISDFGSALIAAGPDAAGLFFYAGHGVQIAGENYLIPIGAVIDKEADAELEAVPANWVLKQMEFAGNRLNIVILDACRNNPLARGMRSANRGLARMDAPKGSFIAYSTAPGETAADGDGKNSPYTLALTKAMQMPGIAIEETFSNARIEVLSATGEKQVPWESSSLTGRFYFQAGTAKPAAAAPAPAAAALVAPVAKSLPSGVTAGQAIKDCPECPEMVAIAPGTFTMGADERENGATDAESPQAEITVSAFALGRYEVTRREFAAFVEASGHQASSSCWGQQSGQKWAFIAGNDWQNPSFKQGEDEPVVCVTPQDAEANIKWLSATSGHHYRLPSEAEWEYAARAGESGRFFWGDDESDFCANANIADKAAKRQFSGWNTISCDDRHAFTAPVGSFKPNRFGILDVLGNVGEIVADCWSDDLEGVDATAKARGPGTCHRYVVRGTGWDSVPQQSRLAYRTKVESTEAYLYNGFRVARSF